MLSKSYQQYAIVAADSAQTLTELLNALNGEAATCPSMDGRRKTRPYAIRYSKCLITGRFGYV